MATTTPNPPTEKQQDFFLPETTNGFTCCGSGNRLTQPTEESGRNPTNVDDIRVYKKTSIDGKLKLYVINRDLISSEDGITPLHGIITVESNELIDKKIFAQIVLTFRYGRDDEEVMGFKLSNESVLCVEQIYPPKDGLASKTSSQCQKILIHRLGSETHLVTMQLTRAAPPSVRLLPAKMYCGAAIGISYDLRIYTVENGDARQQRRNQVRMSLRLIQYATREICQMKAPKLTLEKSFLLRESRVNLEVELDRKCYQHGAAILVIIRITNCSFWTIRKIQVTAIQKVDVSMITNGSFKNIMTTNEDTLQQPLTSGHVIERQVNINMSQSGVTQHWVALEDYRSSQYNPRTLASSTLKTKAQNWNFGIYVTYYIKVLLITTGVSPDLSLKVPFILMRNEPEQAALDGNTPTS